MRKDTAMIANPIQEGAKPRQRLDIKHDMTVSDLEETRASIQSGFKFKTTTLYTFDLHYTRKRSKRHREEQRNETVHMAADSKEVAEKWIFALRHAISQCVREISTDTLPDDDAQSVEMMASDGVEAPPEPSLAVLGNSRGKVLGGVQIAKLRQAFMVYGIMPVFEELDNPGTYISHLIIRAHPQAVFEEILLWSVFTQLDETSVGSMVKEVRILDDSEQSRDIVHIVFSSNRYMAPRDVVIERMWRLEDNGTYIMTFNSVQHDSAPVQQSGFMDWLTPVRMEIQGGWTIAPLQAHHQEEGAEAFVTLAVRTEMEGMIKTLEDYGMNLKIQEQSVHPLFANLLTIRNVVETAKFVGGTQGVMDRLANVQAERRAEEHGKRALRMGTSLTTILAVAKFKKALGSKKRTPAVVLPSSVPRTMWYDPGAVNFKVRGPDYFNDGVKVQTSSPVFQLVALDIFTCENTINEHLAGDKDHVLQTDEAQDGPYTVVFNLMIPASTSYNIVLYYRCSDPKSLVGDSPFALCWNEFLNGNDEERNNRFKMIPKIVEGSWIIKQAVGSTPVIMGKKLRTAYYIGKNYLEVDIDISNSKVAQKVTGMCLPVCKSLTVDMAFLLESHRQIELPESLLGTVRMKKIDLSVALPLPRDLAKKSI
eukprot:CFRG4401T1